MLPLGENPLECRDEIWHQRTRIVGLPDGEKIMTFRKRGIVSKRRKLGFLRFDTLPERDRQTDRHAALAKTRASIASRVKPCKLSQISRNLLLKHLDLFHI